MPIYEYRCRGCKGKFEILVRSSTDYEEISCPMCRSRRVERCFSVFGVRSRGRFTKATSASSCSGCSATSCATCR